MRRVSFPNGHRDVFWRQSRINNRAFESVLVTSICGGDMSFNDFDGTFDKHVIRRAIAYKYFLSGMKEIARIGRRHMWMER
jgi:hypothetical protein